MTPARFRFLKHASAAAFALSVVGVFLVGLDGFLGAVHKLGFLFAPAPAPAAPAAAPPQAADGIVPVFVVPEAAPAGGGPAAQRNPEGRETP